MVATTAATHVDSEFFACQTFTPTLTLKQPSHQTKQEQTQEQHHQQHEIS